MTVRPQQGFIQRVVPALLPVLLVSVGYIDPGKWVANIEGGARFGYDLVAITLLFNLAAILCQYVSARVSVATGRNLAQICNEEYDKWTCMFLGVQAEFSAILLDLTMVLGVAHALNLLLGVDLSTGVFLAAMDAFFFPVFASFLENGMANTVSICSAGLVLFLYVSGVLLSQSEIPFSMNVVLTRLTGESAFALMGLLGASVAPHNFYIHSYFAGGSTTSSSDADKSSLCQDHLFAIFCVFSGLSVVNYVLMNAAANVFHSTGLVVLTFQDAMSLMEQVFGSPLIPLVFLMLLFFSSQITALAWAFGGEVVLHDFLKIEIPSWLHRATIRILAVAPALYCVWTCGADGIYQLLIFTQVLVAMMLPSAAIPLFRIASSRHIMGVHKISQVGEFLALATLLGFLGLNVVFVVEMVFGNSDWAGGLRWNTLTGTSVQYTTLLVSSCASLCLMLWLAATPLKSASNVVEAQIWNMDVQNALSYPSVQEEETGKLETRQDEEESAVQQLESRVKDQLDTTSVTSSVYDLPDNILMTDQNIRSCPLEESKVDVKVSASQVTSFGDVKEETVLQSTVINEVSNKDLVVETKMAKIEPTSPVAVEKTVSMENNIKFIAKDVEGVTWETEEATKAAPASNFPVVSDGPPSFRSLRSEEGGSGTGSLSRLQGLGRAARRHLSAILDEFWGHLYDFHGQLVAEARAKKLDQLLGADQKSAPSPVKVDSFARDTSTGYCMSPTANRLESQMNSNLYDSLKQQQRTPGSIDSLYGLQRGSSPSSSPLVNRMQMMTAYGNTANNNATAYELSERRYSSLRAPSSSESREHQQPATIHGYQIKSYVDSLAKERLEALQSRGEIPTTRSMALGSLSYTQQLALALKQKSQNGLTPGPAPGFENFAGSRNISRQPERSSYYGLPSSGTTDSVNAVVANEKKYSSMPDISGLSMSARNMHSPNNKSGYWDASTGGAGYNSASYGRLSNESPLYSNLGSRVGVASSGYETISQSRGGYRDAYTTLPQSATTGTGSLWSRQPFEQFGVAERNGAVGEEVRNRSAPINIDNNNAASTVDAEAKLLQSFRNCILKLIKLEGSEWLFGQSDGVDEELIDKVAAREKFIYEAETREVGHMGEPQVSSVPNCGDGCVWRADLIVSFGVWCIHRVLDLSLMESRPELWGKYTYVLNRLQGVIDPAFSKLRTPMTPCFCLQIPASHQRASPPSASNGMLPPAARPAKGKCTTAVTLLELIKDVEISISCRKGRTGTAAGDVAFPKGKENLASVLKRYKRRLSNKPTGMNQDGPGSRKNLNAAASVYGPMG